MIRCEICGSKGDSFSEMRDQILELRKENNNYEKLLKEKESEIETQHIIITKTILMTAKAVEALRFCFDNDELEVYEYIKEVQKRSKETLMDLGYIFDD